MNSKNLYFSWFVIIVVAVATPLHIIKYSNITIDGTIKMVYVISIIAILLITATTVIYYLTLPTVDYQKAPRWLNNVILSSYVNKVAVYIIYMPSLVTCMLLATAYAIPFLLVVVFVASWLIKQAIEVIRDLLEDSFSLNNYSDVKILLSEVIENQDLSTEINKAPGTVHICSGLLYMLALDTGLNYTCERDDGVVIRRKSVTYASDVIYVKLHRNNDAFSFVITYNTGAGVVIVNTRATLSAIANNKEMIDKIKKRKPLC